MERSKSVKSAAPENFLSRWSRRKLEAARTEPLAEPTSTPAPGAAVAAPATNNGPGIASESRVTAAVAEAAPALPSLESLTFDSDYSLFLKPGVDASVQRAALRKLLHDPRFNVMDGLDVYIDDYTKASPLDATIARGLVQARYILSPPATRINAQGVVEDVPEAADVQGVLEDVPDEADAPGVVEDVPDETDVPAEQAPDAPGVSSGDTGPGDDLAGRHANSMSGEQLRHDATGDGAARGPQRASASHANQESCK